MRATEKQVAGTSLATFGKVVAGRLYVHASALDGIAPRQQVRIQRAAQKAGASPGADFNVVRIDQDEGSISLLSYPAFFDVGCPALAKSWKIAASGRITLRNYADSLNPPVLHRKELLLDPSDTRRVEFARLTKDLEDLGFFSDPIRIGFKVQWEKLLKERGFKVDRNHLVPLGNVEDYTDAFEAPAMPTISRHLTALSRQNFSAPIQMLRRFGFLDGSRSVFDYGCGKGDDVKWLSANGILASGWDPHFADEAEIRPAQIINLGFVINVIEDPGERLEALQRAFSLAQELLVVSAMIETSHLGKVIPYGDGFLTSRSTFQKYYAQTELQHYLQTSLHRPAVPVAPGVFFVFRSDEHEQQFQLARQLSRVRLKPLNRSPKAPTVQRAPRHSAIEANRTQLEALWRKALDLGRKPEREEVDDLCEIEEKVGSLRRALRLAFDMHEPPLLEQAASQRTNDVKVFLALQLFEKRRAFKLLNRRLQLDIRAFFGDYVNAQEHAQHLLRSIANPEVLDASCRVAAENGLGWLAESHSLQLHSTLVSRLPAELRVYIGCASKLYGDIEQADLIKIHIRSGKVSFLRFDDFFGQAIPKMIERTKVNLRTLDLELYSYGADYAPPPLYLKSRYMNEEMTGYPEQVDFDDAIQKLGFDFSEFGPVAEVFERKLALDRWEVDGLTLVRSRRIPSLDEPCGRYFSYRTLIECGESQAATGLANLPTQPDSYTALWELATTILDPIVDYFGGIELTYGFCSPALSRKIPSRIDPRVDQHAACERKRTGELVCSRQGAAVDFLVRDEDMEEVAAWIVANLPFDRLYFYGNDRPLHVSYGPEHARAAYRMVPTARGTRIPKSLR